MSLIVNILLIVLLTVLSLFFFSYLGIIVPFIILDVTLLFKNINEIFHVKNFVMLGIEESFLADRLSAKNTGFYSDRNVESSSSNAENTGYVPTNPGNIASASNSTNRYSTIAPRPIENSNNRMGVSSLLNPEPVITTITYPLNIYSNRTNQQEVINSLPSSYSSFSDYSLKCNEILRLSRDNIKDYRNISRSLDSLKDIIPGIS